MFTKKLNNRYIMFYGKHTLRQYSKRKNDGNYETDKDGNILLVQPSVTPPEGLSYSARVNSDGNMVLRFINHTSSTIDLGSGWVVVIVEF